VRAAAQPPATGRRGAEALEARRLELESEREELRAQVGAARAQAQADQVRAREVEIQLESRRSAQASTLTGLERMRVQ